MNGLELIAAERRRQIEQEGWTSEHDNGHTAGELAMAAACYALHHTNARAVDPRREEHIDAEDFPEGQNIVVSYGADAWPWDRRWWKPSRDPVRNLVKAGALILAEIDRLQRASPPVQPDAATS